MQFNGVETDSDSYATFDDMTYRMSLPIARKLIYKVLNKNAAGIATEQNADRIYKLACNRTKDETHQAMEAAIHNFNSLHSRAGSQTPFSSINYGLCTTPEGRLVIDETLNAINEGLGHGETPIFPISVFQLKAGVNYNPGDPNYDLFQKSCTVSAKRLFPNYLSLDADYNAQYYVKDDPDTHVATMG